MNSKHYILDTNVLLEDPKALFKLRNGNENHIFIPYHALLELNKFKKDPKLRHIVARVIGYLVENPEHFTILSASSVADPFAGLVDYFILDEIQDSSIEKPILVTNDRVFHLQARLRGIKSEIYKESVPFKSDAEYNTGFMDRDEAELINCFTWSEQGKPIFHGPKGPKAVDYQNRIWKVAPRNLYQNLAIELMIDLDLKVVSVQSSAGYGKSFLALAAALYQVLEKKTHQKIFVIKPMIEIGQKLGYLPGKLEEKMEP